jgi:hypothetical protein
MKRLALLAIILSLALSGCAQGNIRPDGTTPTAKDTQCDYAQKALILADIWLSSGEMSPSLHEYWAKYKIGAVASVILFCGN